MTRTTKIFAITIYIHTKYINTQQILNENNEGSESISTPSSNLRYKNYETNTNGNEKYALYKLRPENPEGTISHININSIRNKFYCLAAFTKNEEDIFLWQEVRK